MKYNVGYLFELAVVITQKELKVRYKSSFLGYLWSIANPLLFAMIYFFVFKMIMKIQIPNYTLFLITGLFPWQWFSGSVTNSLFSFINNAQIIKKVVFPRSVIPISNVLMELFHFCCTLPVIVFFLFIYDKTPSIDWIWGIPILILVQMILSSGLALAFSTLNLFFRDLERFVTLGIMVLFYFTPILYDLKMIPEKYKWAIELNPIALLINSWRDLLMNGELSYYVIVKLFVFAMVIFSIGAFIFNKLKFRFAEIL